MKQSKKAVDKPRKGKAVTDAGKVEICVDALRTLDSGNLERILAPMEVVVATLWGGDRERARKEHATDVNFKALYGSSELIGTVLSKKTLQNHLRVYLQQLVIAPEVLDSLKLGQRIELLKARDDATMALVAGQVAAREQAGVKVSTREVARLVREANPAREAATGIGKTVRKLEGIAADLAGLSGDGLHDLTEADLQELVNRNGLIADLQTVMTAASTELLARQDGSAPQLLKKKRIRNDQDGSTENAFSRDGPTTTAAVVDQPGETALESHAPSDPPPELPVAAAAGAAESAASAELVATQGGSAPQLPKKRRIRGDQAVETEKALSCDVPVATTAAASVASETAQEAKASAILPADVAAAAEVGGNAGPEKLETVAATGVAAAGRQIMRQAVKEAPVSAGDAAPMRKPAASMCAVPHAGAAGVSSFDAAGIPFLALMRAAAPTKFGAIAAARDHYRAQYDERLAGLRDLVHGTADVSLLVADLGIAAHDLGADELVQHLVDDGYVVEDGRLAQRPLAPWNASTWWTGKPLHWAHSLETMHIRHYQVLDALVDHMSVEFEARVDTMVGMSVTAAKVTPTFRDQVARFAPDLAERLKDANAIVTVSAADAKSLAQQGYASISGTLSPKSYDLPGDKTRPSAASVPKAA